MLLCYKLWYSNSSVKWQCTANSVQHSKLVKEAPRPRPALDPASRHLHTIPTAPTQQLLLESAIPGGGAPRHQQVHYTRPLSSLKCRPGSTSLIAGRKQKIEKTTTPNTWRDCPPRAEHGRPRWLWSGPLARHPPAIIHPVPNPLPVAVLDKCVPRRVKG